MWGQVYACTLGASQFFIEGPKRAKLRYAASNFVVHCSSKRNPELKIVHYIIIRINKSSVIYQLIHPAGALEFAVLACFLLSLELTAIPTLSFPSFQCIVSHHPALILIYNG